MITNLISHEEEFQNLNFYKEFELIKENIIYKIIIYKKDDEIIIKHMNYIKNYNLNDLSKLFEKSSFHLIDEYCEYIKNKFNKKRIHIKSHTNEILTLFLERNNGTLIEMNLINQKINKSNNKHLKNDILEITLLSDVLLNSYTCMFSNSFLYFKTFDDLNYLVYSSKNNSIICFDLYKNQKIVEIKNNEIISSFRNFSDKKNKRDFILAVFPNKNNLRIWNVKNWQCILYINQVYNEASIYSACFLNDNGNIFVIASNCDYFGVSESIKVFDFNGNKIKEINDSNDATLTIDIYFDKINSKKYIITGNKHYLKSFDYDKNILYQKYYEEDCSSHYSFIIDDKKEITKLFESCKDGNIRIWNFHSGILLIKIKISDQSLYDICLWDDKFLLVACHDKEIKILDLTNNKIVKKLIRHNNSVISLKKINHIKFGECLISHGYENDQFKIWGFKN